MKTQTNLTPRNASPYYWCMDRENLFVLYRRKRDGRRELVDVFNHPENAAKECKAWTLTDQIIRQRIEYAEAVVPRKNKPKAQPWSWDRMAYIFMVLMLINGAAKFMKAAEMEYTKASITPLSFEPSILVSSPSIKTNH